MKGTFAALACVAALTFVGCSASASGGSKSSSTGAQAPVNCSDPSLSQEQWIDHCATGQLTSMVSPPVISYSNPAKMLTKLNDAGFKCDNDYRSSKKPTQDAVGALRLPCSHGNQEIDLMTFPSTASKAAEQAAAARISTSVAYWTDTWAVAAPTRKVLGQVVVILES